MGVPKNEWIRKAAKEAGQKYYFPIRPCKRGHVSKRLVSYGQCLACCLILRKQYCKNNPEKVRLQHRLTKNKHQDRVKENWKSWYARNKNYLAEKQKSHRAQNNAKAAKWRAENPEKVLVIRRKYRRKNKHAISKRNVVRYFSRKIATPVWADLNEIVKVYERAVALSSQTGTKQHVDHIVPLNGKNVCGLHVHYNLQVLPAAENLKKSNFLGEKPLGPYSERV